MKFEVSKNMLVGALATLGKLVSRMSPVEEYKSVLIVMENETLRFHTCGPEETMEFTLDSEAEGSFRQLVHFDTLQKVVGRGKGKEVSLEVESEILLVNGGPEGAPIMTEASRLREGGGNPCVMENGFVISRTA